MISNLSSQINSWLKDRPHISLISSVPPNARVPIRWKCSKHNFIWETAATNIIRSPRKGCKFCASNKFIKPFYEKLKYFPHISIEGPNPVKGPDVVTLYCSNHNVSNSKTVQTFARQVHLCNICARESSINNKAFSNWKRYKLGHKFIQVQGFEHTALDYIQSKGIKSHEIRVHGSGNVPTISYGQRKYFPDFYLPKMNRVIEVKSMFTSGLWGKVGDVITDMQIDQFEMLCEKRKATISAGYSFKLLIFDSKKLIKLPKYWWRYSIEELRYVLLK